MRIFIFYLLLFVLVFPTQSYSGAKPSNKEITKNFTELRYNNFTLWYSCERKGTMFFSFETIPDAGDAKKPGSFHYDDDLSIECQQTSLGTYKPGNLWHRGHLVAANLWDHSDEAILETNVITNVIPQTRTSNIGAWRRTEAITDCKRDETTVSVFGGVIWGTDQTNDHFIGSHGIETPDKLFKILITSNDEVIAWVIPNNKEAYWRNLDQYIHSIAEIESELGFSFGYNEKYRHIKPKKSWPAPKKCWS